MEPIRDAEKISELAFAFMGSKALFAALHIDLFAHLADGPLGLDELAEKAQVPTHRVTTLVTALTSLGLIVKDGERVANAPGAQDYLVPTARGYFGDYLKYQIDQQMYPFMENLDAVLVGDLDKVKYDSYAKWMDDAEEAELFSQSQHGGSLGPGAVLAKQVDLSKARSLLDVGGGTGAFSIMMCKRYPELSATVLDFPNVCETGKPFVAEAGMEKRIGFLPGDALTTKWPHQQDAVLMSYICGGVPHDSVPDLCASAFAALNEGGWVIIHDFMVEDDRTGPTLAALWALQHMVYTPDGIALTPGMLTADLEKAGFEDIELRELIPGMTKVIWARKPRSSS